MSRRSRLYPPLGTGPPVPTPWTPGAPDRLSTSTPDKSHKATKSLLGKSWRRLILAVVSSACGVLLAVLVIGAIDATNHSGTDQKVSSASSSTVTTGAGAVSSTTTGGQTAPDFKTFQDRTNNFSIGTPPSWRQVSLSDPQAQAAIDQVIAQNPQFGKALGGATTLASQGIKFLAVDPSGGSTVTVAVDSAAGSPADPTDSDLQAGVPDITKALESTGAQVTSHEIVTVNGHKAIRVLYDLPLTNGGADLHVHGAAYFFVTKDTIHAVTIVGKADIVDQVISTFTIG